jgi:hypothetical protein
MKTVFFGLVLAGVAVNAHALGRIANVQIVDRETGAVLTPYRYRGEYWVAGTPGNRYSVLIRNDRGDRLLAVTAVDGINVISGETAAWGQSGYVYGPGESYAIDGWRKSNQEIAAFEFTASPNSYAERTGRPANIGVIGVALFLERPVAPPAISYSSPPFGSEDSSRVAPAAPAASAGEPTSPRARSEAPLAGPANSASNIAQPGRELPAPDSPAAKLGTGHGARETSVVSSTQFHRLSNTPNEIIRIRYDSWDNLVAMGVIQPRRPLAPTPNAFPESAVSQFVPDPPSNLPYGRR